MKQLHGCLFNLKSTVIPLSYFQEIVSVHIQSVFAEEDNFLPYLFVPRVYLSKFWILEGLEDAIVFCTSLAVLKFTACGDSKHPECSLSFKLVS